MKLLVLIVSWFYLIVYAFFCTNARIITSTFPPFTTLYPLPGYMKVAIVSFGGVCRAPYAAEVMNTVARRKGVGRLLRCKSYSLLKTFANKHVDPSAIHLLSPKQMIPYRGENLQLFDPVTMNDYDYILATDTKSWAMLTEIALSNVTAKIELLGLYDPYEKILDFPDIFNELRRGDDGRRLRWGMRRVYRAAQIFVDRHYEEIRNRWQPRTIATHSSLDISYESRSIEDENDSEPTPKNLPDLVSAENNSKAVAKNLADLVSAE